MADPPFVSQKEEAFFSDKCYHGREDWGLGHTAALSRLECAVLHYPETSFIEWCPRTLRGGDTVLGTGNVRWGEVSVFPPSFSAGTSAGDSTEAAFITLSLPWQNPRTKSNFWEKVLILAYVSKEEESTMQRGVAASSGLTPLLRESEQYDLKGHLQ